jgi:hypothetical protein
MDGNDTNKSYEIKEIAFGSPDFLASSVWRNLEEETG